MVIHFVRHGHPDYKNDCLTDTGKEQARRASLRLSTYGIERIFSSTNGRAYQTAEFTANLLNLPIIPCDFMREISWGSITGEPILENGHPWNVARAYASAGKSLADPNWHQMDPYCKSEVVRKVDAVISGFDSLLLELGYKREGEYYRVIGDDTDKTIAVFSHGGSSSAVISHLLNIPFSQICSFLYIGFTSITTIELSCEKGRLVGPTLMGANDVQHIKGITVENVYGN